MAIIKSSSFLLLVAPWECWSCHGPTPVAVLAASTGSQVLDEEDDDPHWEALPEEQVVKGVTAVDAVLAKAISGSFPNLRPDDSNTLGLRYWMNHCEKCQARIGDHFIHSEPDSPFFAWPHAGDPSGQHDLGPGEIECDLPYF